MLIEFTIKNFKTFRDKTVFSQVAANYDKETRESENVVHIPGFDLRVLKSSVVYGANASGKSKLFEALGFMQEYLLRSMELSLMSSLNSEISFKLDAESEQLPSEFEVVFLSNKKVYRYGFTLLPGKVITEWLYMRSHKKEMEIFFRNGDNFKLHRSLFKRGKNIIREGFVRESALCVTVAATFNEELALEVLGWFKNLQIFSGLTEDSFINSTLSMITDEKRKMKVLNFLYAADLGITDIYLTPSSSLGQSELFNSEEYKRKLKYDLDLFYEVKTVHKKYDKGKQHSDRVIFSMDSDESSGTRKFFALAGPIIQALETGSILVVDELDSKLHPKLVLKIAELFNSVSTNPRNSQLIFNTQSTHLLSSDLFRRDQVWFVEKNRFEVSKLYSLVEIKVRRTDKFENDYLDGRYGGMPFLGEFDDLRFSDLSGSVN